MTGNRARGRKIPEGALAERKLDGRQELIGLSLEGEPRQAAGPCRRDLRRSLVDVKRRILDQTVALDRQADGLIQSQQLLVRLSIRELRSPRRSKQREQQYTEHNPSGWTSFAATRFLARSG